MVRRDASGRRDRILAAIEILALGIWVGSLVAFAFVFAPLAFRLIAPLDVTRFGALIARTLGALSQWGYALGGVAVLTALLRAIDAGDRVWDIARAGLVVVALGLTTIEQRAIVPRMEATTDVNSDAYRALHRESTQIYGGALIFGLAALALAAARRED